jgi:aminoethylphosphonate catabolism LysR family transcriptional regulator
MTINFTQLRAFHAVARNGSFTLAARELHVSQPTVSERVRELEANYNIHVFTRANRKVKLTVVGRSLYEITQRFFEVAGEAENFLRAAADHGSGHLRISSVLPFFVVEVLRAFRQSFPQTKISVSADSIETTVSNLLTYEADVGVMSDHDLDERFYIHTYNSHLVVAIVSRDHPWAKLKGIKLGQLDGQDMVMREVGSNTRRAFEAAIVKANVNPNIVLETASGDAVREAVADGHGIGIYGERGFPDDPRLKALPFLDTNIQLDRYLVCLRERKDEPLIQTILSMPDRPL